MLVHHLGKHFIEVINEHFKSSIKRLVELSILKERTKSAQARKAVALFGKHIYLVSFWHQRACKILAGLE